MHRESSASGSLETARALRCRAVEYLQDTQGNYVEGEFMLWRAEQAASRVRAALGHEVFAAYQLGELSCDAVTVADKLLPTWAGSELEPFLDVVAQLSK